MLTILIKDSCGVCSVLQIYASFSFLNQLILVHVRAHQCRVILRLSSCIQEENVTAGIIVAVDTE